MENEIAVRGLERRNDIQVVLANAREQTMNFGEDGGEKKSPLRVKLVESDRSFPVWAATLDAILCPARN
jgi:hypothetical protein